MDGQVIHGGAVTTYLAKTSRFASNPMRIMIDRETGNVHVSGRATHHQLARVIEHIIDDARKGSLEH